MKFLSQLTPAETDILLNENDVELKLLLKLTFMDLLMKNVLKVIIVERQSGRSRIKYYNYVIIGSNFNQYKALPHEKVFLSPFEKSSSIQILFRHIVTLGYQNAGSKRSFIQSKLNASPNLTNHFSNNFFKRLLGRVKLSDSGQAVRSQLLYELDDLKKRITQLLPDKKEEIKSILKKVNGNIHHLRDFDFNLLKDINIHLQKDFTQKENSTSSGCYGCGCWNSYDSYGDSFDSNYDSAESSGCSSGDGCNSCNSCGGCGGCGGCG